MPSYLRPLIFSTLLVSACSAVPAVGSNTRTDDLSAAGHRAEAASHRAEARDLERSGRGPTRGPFAYEMDRRGEAVGQNREAVTHDRQAATLAQALDTECASIPPTERSRCDTGKHGLASIDDLPGGVRIRLAPGGEPLQPTLARARCTHAYADFAGRESLPQCLVAVRDLTIQGQEDSAGITLTLTTTDAAAVTELKRRARAMMAPQP